MELIDISTFLDEDWEKLDEMFAWSLEDIVDEIVDVVGVESGGVEVGLESGTGLNLWVEQEIQGLKYRFHIFMEEKRSWL